MRIQHIPGLLVDAVYPRVCPVCDRILPYGLDICRDCETKPVYVPDEHCMKCGKPVEEDREYCDDCERAEHIYDEGRAALVYDEYMSKSIYRFKYNGRREYSRLYGKIICDSLAGKIRSWNVQVIIPVPIHKSKLKQRGYNQAALIAREISRRLKIPVNENIISRRTATRVQKDLSASERQNNLKKAFIVTQNVVELKTVLIVDDIYTTGATADAVALCLKSAGIEKVYAVSLCIGRGY